MATQLYSVSAIFGPKIHCYPLQIPIFLAVFEKFLFFWGQLGFPFPSSRLPFSSWISSLLNLKFLLTITHLSGRS